MSVLAGTVAPMDELVRRRTAAQALLDALVAADPDGGGDVDEAAVTRALEGAGLSRGTFAEAAPVLGGALDVLTACVHLIAYSRGADVGSVVEVLRTHLDETVYDAGLPSWDDS